MSFGRSPFGRIVLKMLEQESDREIRRQQRRAERRQTKRSLARTKPKPDVDSAQPIERPEDQVPEWEEQERAQRNRSKETSVSEGRVRRSTAGVEHTQQCLEVNWDFVKKVWLFCTFSVVFVVFLPHFLAALWEGRFRF